VEEEDEVDIQHRWVLRLGKTDGKFEPWHITEEDFDLDFSTFIHALNLYNAIDEVKDRERAINATEKAEKKVRKEAAKAAEKVAKAEAKAEVKAEKEAVKVALKLAKLEARRAKGKTEVVAEQSVEEPLSQTLGYMEVIKRMGV